MKKSVMGLVISSLFTIASQAQAADVNAFATASWSATAKKDTSSKLVVTPVGSLSFEYAQGIKGFNSQKGLFDVTIEGDTAATGFKLTSKLASNTLTQLDASGSTLKVGVKYNGENVTKEKATTMIDTASGVLGGNLGAVINGFNKTGRSSSQDQFTFNIASATSDGNTPVTDLSKLPEGIWSGEVSVEFQATWTKPAA